MRPGARGALLLLLAGLSAGASGANAADSRRAQQILFPEIPAHAPTDAPFDLAARASSGLPVAFSLVAGPAVLAGRRVKLTGQPGLVVVRATQAGNDSFQPAVDAERAFSVGEKPGAPAIRVQPLPRSAGLGDLVVLSVGATGGSLAYQWRKDGRPITGANEAQLSLPSVQQGDAGVYDVVVSNAAGSARSAGARLSVGRHGQTILFQAVTTAFANQPVQLVATASSGLPVRFEIVSGSGTINGSTLTAYLGSVVVQAEQEGDSAFEAAPSARQMIAIQPSPGRPALP
ncbi:MAG TPA: immunoglobulin domain-containing protein [Opitutaceae bacterium]|jgi:hypothetical protein